MKKTFIFFLFSLFFAYSCGSDSGGGSTPTPSPTLSAPTANAASDPTENSFQANWSAVSGATEYLLDVGTDQNFSTFVSGFNARSVSSTSASVTGLNPETDYFYRVKAKNGSTTSGFSNVVSTKTAAKKVEPQPLGVPSAQVATNISPNSFQANWSAVSGATNYLLDVSTNNNFSSFLPNFQNRSVSGTSVEVTGLTAQTTYYYRVRAADATRQSTYSNTVLVSTANAPAVAQNFTALETFITEEMNANKINGLAGFIIKNNQVVWKKGFGKANVAENKNVDTETVFMLASVSKTVTGVVLMTLFDQGKFKLDDDINKYLPFKVTNPNFPNDPITIRMILTHTSSIQDNSYNALSRSITYRDGVDHPVPLSEFMKDCLSPDGKYYDAKELFLNEKPGTRTKYSNLSSALCGYLAEVLAGESFHTYSKKVFAPLGFKNSAWALKDLNLSNVSLPYTESGEARQLYSFVDYPNGGFRTHVEDFSKYLLMIMNGGTYNGSKILERSTMDEMLKAQNLGDKSFGLKFSVYEDETGHSGSETGISSEMYFNPSTKIGVFVVFNKQLDNVGTKIKKKMFEEAAK